MQQIPQKLIKIQFYIAKFNNYYNKIFLPIYLLLRLFTMLTIGIS